MSDEERAMDRMMSYKNFRKEARTAWIIRTYKDKYGRDRTFSSTWAGLRKKVQAAQKIAEDDT
jgi:hypothetical protein